VARDRKRAKQRRERGRATSVGRPPAAGSEPVPAEESGKSSIERADVPGALDHASADVDEFDAALVRGAEGVPAQEEQELAAEDIGAEDQLEAVGGGPPAGGGAGGGRGGGDGSGGHPSGAPLRGGNRAIGFIRASWAELQRVQWPDRRAVAQATAVVLGFVAIAGAYLGLADVVAKEIVEFIIG
jgi:preprotein translocase SecE subunit